MLFDYYQRIEEMLKTIMEEEGDVLDLVADAIYLSLQNGGITHIFGSGHSQLLAQDFTGRAGGLVPVNAIIDRTEGRAERLEGYAKLLIKEHEEKVRLKAGEVLIVVSNSGRNPLPIEMALEAKDRGMKLVAVTSLVFSRQITSRHSSGQNLYEICDYVIDNKGIPGDAIMEIPDFKVHAASTSTITGSFILNSLTIKVVQRYVHHKRQPPIHRSLNLD